MTYSEEVPRLLRGAKRQAGKQNCRNNDYDTNVLDKRKMTATFQQRWDQLCGQ